MRPGTRTATILTTLTCAFVLLASSAAWAAKSVPVKAGKRDDFVGTGNQSWFAWEERLPGSKNHWDVWAQRNGHKPFKVNAKGTSAYLGQMDQQSDELVFQQVRKGNSDIKLIHLATRTFVPLPAGVNTRAWEWSPSFSADRLAFARQMTSTDDILVDADITASPAGPLITIASIPHNYKKGTGLNGYSTTQSNGNWTVWVTCGAKSCSVLRHQDGGGTDKVPSGGRPVQYGGSVLSDGTVFFGSSSDACGRNARIMSWSGSGQAHAVYVFPKGIDTNTTSVWTDGVSTDLWYSRIRCGQKHGDWDIYKLVNPSTLRVTRSAPGARVGAPGRPAPPVPYRTGAPMRNRPLRPGRS